MEAVATLELSTRTNAIVIAERPLRDGENSFRLFVMLIVYAYSCKSDKAC